MRMAARLEAMGASKYRGLTRKSGRRYVWTGKVSLDEEAIRLVQLQSSYQAASKVVTDALELGAPNPLASMAVTPSWAARKPVLLIIQLPSGWM